MKEASQGCKAQRIQHGHIRAVVNCKEPWQAPVRLSNEDRNEVLFEVKALGAGEMLQWLRGGKASSEDTSLVPNIVLRRLTVTCLTLGPATPFSRL